jgi:steroid delta-isomerase-like uncharacterized protein
MTPTEDANVHLAREHFAAESAHDSGRTLTTLADDVTYRVVASGVVLRTKADVARYYDLWWKAFPDVVIEIKRLVASGEWVIAENVATATHLGPFLGLPPSGRKVVQHLVALIRIQDGKMVEETVYYDQLERIRQLGSSLALDGRPLDLPSA